MGVDKKIMGIEIKNNKVLENILEVGYQPHLIFLINWVTVRNSKIVITSGYRKGDKGVHGTLPCRGIDIRSRIYENPQAIVDDINRHFIYDINRPEKKCAILHNVGHGEHIHLQVHPNTKYLKGY